MKREGNRGRGVRLEKLLKTALAKRLQEWSIREDDISCAGLATLNHVSLNRDLSVARVFVSFLGGEGNEARAVERLGQLAGRDRGAIGRSLGLARVPRLHFVHDQSPEFLQRLDEARRDDVARANEE